MFSTFQSLKVKLQTFVDDFRRQDHFAPHTNAGFEGYYSRTQLDDGSTLAIIFCWVTAATQRPNLVHVSYTPSPTSASRVDAFKHEFFPELVEATTCAPLDDGQQPFSIRAPGIGTMLVSGDTAQYTIEPANSDLRISLVLSQRTPWSASDPFAGPMGVFAAFSSFLPLNWRVHSTASKAAYSISVAGRTLHGTGVSHLEKNWGKAFPEGWIWSQSFAGTGENKTSLCLAGGRVLPGVQAYLIGYRSPSLQWDFRPPYAMMLGSWFAPHIQVVHDSKTGMFGLSVETHDRKLMLRVDALPESFLGLAAPYADGHRPNYAFESFSGETWVQAWGRKSLWQEWTLLEEGECGVLSDGTPCSALEFGGTFSHHVKAEEPKNR